MLPSSLRFKIGVYPALALLVALILFAVLVVRYQREQILGEAVRHVTQLSDVLIRSTRFAMLQDQPEYVHQAIQDVVGQGTIEKISIISKEGVIIDTTYPPELKMKIDRQAEGCSLCHQTDRPLQRIGRADRARIFISPSGKRKLASMEVIRNEPSCYSAACHVHSSEQSVLGVLDIVYPLDEIDQSMQRSGTVVVLVLVGLMSAVAIFFSVFVRRVVHRPLRDLAAGAGRVAAGDLGAEIPVRGSDELGRLATSFNSMTEALRHSREQLRQWNQELERKIEQRTRELRRAEAEAARGEKLASVGLLAAGVAHELNNPLTGILTFSTLIRRKMADGSPEAEDLDLVIKETRRCAAIIRRLLDFAREKAPEKKYTDINAVIEGTIQIVDGVAGMREAKISTELDRELPLIWIDANMIEQVIMNMLVNAQHAIEQRKRDDGALDGRIVVRTRRAARDRAPNPGEAPEPMLEIEIEDNGCGIAEVDLRRIFDPFFTSKEVGRGTGLGLSVSHGIVKAHGGDIEVESSPGMGSTFRVFLPLHAAPTIQGPATPSSDGDDGGVA